MSDLSAVTGWTQLALRRDIVVRGVKVGLVVGTILAVINHGDELLAGDVDTDMLFKIILTYLVPYSVSTWASVQTARAANPPD